MLGWNRAEQSSNIGADGGSMNEELARCNREIAEASQQTEAPAWLVTLGVEDWEAEKCWILAQETSSTVLVLPDDLWAIR